MKLTPQEKIREKELLAELEEVEWVLIHKDGKHLVPKNNTHFLDCNLIPRALTMSCDGGMVLVEMEDYEVEFLED